MHYYESVVLISILSSLGGIKVSFTYNFALDMLGWPIGSAWQERIKPVQDHYSQWRAAFRLPSAESLSWDPQALVAVRSQGGLFPRL